MARHTVENRSVTAYGQGVAKEAVKEISVSYRQHSEYDPKSNKVNIATKAYSVVDNNKSQVVSPELNFKNLETALAQHGSLKELSGNQITGFDNR